MNFFNNLDQQRLELNCLNKLTIDNSIEWINQIKSYLSKNNLNDFLMPKNNYSFKENHLLSDLILSTISDEFKMIYLNNFKHYSFNDLWLELNRCFQYPKLKPILIKLKSIKLDQFDNLNDYCKEFSNLLDEIPIEFIDNNFHNIMSLFYQSNDNKIIHICFKRLVDNNQKLILPKNKLSNNQLNKKKYQQINQKHSTSGKITNQINFRSFNSTNQTNFRSINSTNQTNSSNIKYQEHNLVNQSHIGIVKNSKSINEKFKNLNQQNRIICNYCKNDGHLKNNCLKLKNKLSR